VAVRRPSTQDWADLSAKFGFDLSTVEIAELAEITEATLSAYDRLDELPDVRLPVKYPRTDSGYRPIGEDNPHNGWAWKCSIEGADTGPLAGKRIAIKDCVEVAGVPMMLGSELMEGFVPNEDATVVTRILDAGGEIVGKTVVPAFCFDGAGITCYPGPQPTNPHDPTRCPGASSTGSAIVVVTGEADMAIGGDQGGSIRHPASWSGCCGLKPTHGLVPYTGAAPIEMTLDHLGPMARTVEDCALLLGVIAGIDGHDPRQPDIPIPVYTELLTDQIDGIRVGVLSEGFGRAESEADVDAAVQETARALKAFGAHVDEVSVPMHRDGSLIWSAIAQEGATYQMLNSGGLGSNWRGHYSTGLLDALSRGSKARSRDFPITVKITAAVGAYLSEKYNHHYYAKAQNLGRQLRSAYDVALADYDVLVLPTTPMKAQPRPDSPGPKELISTALGMINNTSPFDVTGHPAMSVPCGVSEGLPIGFMIVGRHFEEPTVLRVALAVQNLTQARDEGGVKK
jgi:amidase